MKSRTVPILIVSAGVLFVLAYWALSLTGVGGIGEEADIGGGLILLIGYGLILVGIASLVTIALVCKSRNRK